MRKLLSPVCSYVNKQANTKQHWAPSWCGLKAQNEDTVVQGPRLVAEGGIRRGREGHWKWALSSIKAHVGGWGGGSRSAKLAEVTLSTRHFWWEVNIPGYHRAIPSALYTTLLYGEVAGLRLSQTEAPACVNSK